MNKITREARKRQAVMKWAERNERPRPLQYREKPQ